MYFRRFAARARASDRRRPNQRLRIAFLVRNLGLDGSFWITDDLVRSFAESGHEVTVLHYDQRAVGPPTHLVDLLGRCRVRTYQSADPRTHPWRFLWRHVNMLAHFGGHFLSNEYDLVIGHTLLSSMTPLGPLARILMRARYAGLVWDFYPIQWQESRLVRGRLLTALFRSAERFEFRHLDIAIVPTKDNADFLAEYHPRCRARLLISGICRDARNFPVPFSPSEKRITGSGLEVVIFGGAIQEGRDFGGVLEAATILASTRPTVRVIFMGGGRTLEVLREAVSAKKVTNVDVMARLPFSEYIDFLRTCSAGLVVTSDYVSVPSFPSKTVDYMATGLPVVACVRQDSDFARLISKEWRCGVVAPVSDPRVIADAICKVLDDRRNADGMGRAARVAFLHHLQPRTLVRQLESLP